MDKDEIQSLIQNVPRQVAEEVTAPLVTSVEFNNLVQTIKDLQSVNETLKRENEDQKIRTDMLE